MNAVETLKKIAELLSKGGYERGLLRAIFGATPCSESALRVYTPTLLVGEEYPPMPAACVWSIIAQLEPKKFGPVGAASDVMDVSYTMQVLDLLNGVGTKAALIVLELEKASSDLVKELAKLMEARQSGDRAVFVARFGDMKRVLEVAHNALQRLIKTL